MLLLSLQFFNNNFWRPIDEVTVNEFTYKLVSILIIHDHWSSFQVVACAGERSLIFIDTILDLI